MFAYIVRRLLLAIPTLLLVTSIVFGLIRFVPGDVLSAMLEETLTNTPLAEIEKLKAELGFDQPLYIQYANFIWGVVRGDLGKSLRDREPVVSKIGAALPVTFELAVLAMIWAIAVAIPVGVLSAIRQDTVLDYVLRGVAILGISLPSFWIGTLAVVLPAIWLKWVPPLSYVSIFDDWATNLKQFAIPAVILGILLSGRLMRMTRTMMLEVMRQDYIRTAWAKGLRERGVIFRHALKNAMIPVATVLGLEIAFLIGGTVVIESIFVLPGMGRLFIEALTFRDYPVIQGINVIVAAWVVLINLLVDVSYAFIDPRIRYK